MAEALLRHLRGDEYEALSAGTDPTGLNIHALKALKEIGIDTSPLRSKSVEEYLDRDIDIVITVCDHAREACPFFPGGRRRIHKGFRDPSDLVNEGMDESRAYREIRDRISEYIRDFKPE
jgi:arsenate reductase